ncbi:ADP-ribose-binding protein [Candidatus Pacearchaeota archaeon]|nr:ADP-ribose-binding protein [Candidatus Pacearchaeota archaeon]
MKEINGDIFKLAAEAICVTTNGMIKKNQEAVMGAGIALTAKNKYPNLPLSLAIKLRIGGNHVFHIPQDGVNIITFPTKNHWRDDSSITLIVQSCKELVALADDKGWENILLPRPGCSNGKLEWEKVKLIIEPLLDDRFTVVTL